MWSVIKDVDSQEDDAEMLLVVKNLLQVVKEIRFSAEEFQELYFNEANGVKFIKLKEELELSLTSMSINT